MIGILGGTFDPPHVGHLAVAHAAYEQLDIDEVRLVPAGDPWQKTGDLVSPVSDRIAMTRLAAAESERFVVDDIETERSGPSYTIDTVEALGAGVVLILGSDAAFGIPSWHRGPDLLKLVDLAVVERPGTPAARVEEVLGVPTTRISMPSIELSGTEIRRYISAGHSPRFLVPGAVCDYILANDLYR